MLESKSLNLEVMMDSGKQKNSCSLQKKSKPMTVLSPADSNGAMAKQSPAVFRMSVGAARA